MKKRLYVALLAALVCGLLLHLVAKIRAQKYSHEKAAALREAVRRSETYSDTNDLKTKFLVTERVVLCGNIFVGLGIGLFALWIVLGGRQLISIPLLLLLVEIALKQFL